MPLEFQVLEALTTNYLQFQEAPDDYRACSRLFFRWKNCPCRLQEVEDLIFDAKSDYEIRAKALRSHNQLAK